MLDSLTDPDWDQPFFKVLAHNDTGAARGHQGGAAIPKDLRRYFPTLAGTISATNPTIDRRLTADLYLEDKFVATVSTRYQFQTWGGKRSPESRLTDNLGQLRSRATDGDLLLMQRQTSSLDHYRLILIRKSAPEFAKFAKLTTASRWGILASLEPMTQADLAEAAKEEAVTEEGTFNLFEINPPTVQTSGRRIARGIVFRETLRRVYAGTCCVCGTSLSTPSGQRDFEGAHIVPRALLGADDARNGLGLCRRHHWAFDRGLFGVASTRRVLVSPAALVMPENIELRQLNGRQISESSQTSLRASEDALQWHIDNVVAAVR
jgi:putative restriction endonuclease